MSQDITKCHLCGEPLRITPRLGDWIMHPHCSEELMRRLEEAEHRATRAAEATIVEWLRSEDAAVQSQSELRAARILADSIEHGQHRRQP